MNTIVVKTQAQWDALPKRFAEPTVIEIDGNLWLRVQSVPINSRVALFPAPPDKLILPEDWMTK